MQGIITSFNFGFNQIEFFYYFVWKQFFKIFHTLPISTCCNIIFVITSFISPYKNIITPQHNISSLNMNLLRWTNHLSRIHFINHILNCIQFTLSIWENIGLNKYIINNKTNITGKDLIVILNNIRTIHGYTILFENCFESIHFFNHIDLKRIGSR